jgi:hypothetical protein
MTFSSLVVRTIRRVTGATRRREFDNCERGDVIRYWDAIWFTCDARNNQWFGGCDRRKGHRGQHVLLHYGREVYRTWTD